MVLSYSTILDVESSKPVVSEHSRRSSFFPYQNRFVPPSINLSSVVRPARVFAYLSRPSSWWHTPTRRQRFDRDERSRQNASFISTTFHLLPQLFLPSFDILIFTPTYASDLFRLSHGNVQRTTATNAPKEV